jgi:hypothetical protein
MDRTPSELWILALAGVSTQAESGNVYNHREIGGWSPSDQSRAWCRNVLTKLYGVESREGLEQSIRYLLDTGHTAEARAIASGSKGPASYHADLVRTHASEIASRGLMAWDVARAVTIASWGTLGGYLTEDDLWSTLWPVAERAQGAYASWRAYGDGYLLGQAFWNGGQRHEPTDKALEALHSHPESPWVTLPWSLPLARRSSGEGDPIVFPGQRVAKLSDYVRLMRGAQSGDMMGALEREGLGLDDYARVAQAWGQRLASDPDLSARFVRLMSG